jgi:hypothetical protein
MFIFAQNHNRKCLVKQRLHTFFFKRTSSFEAGEEKFKKLFYMANFEGTKEEFAKFIGPYARNSVQILSKNLKERIGKCEKCGIRTKKLDAAHRKGFERNSIIAAILWENMEEDTVNIDLDAFTEQFKEAHTPAEKVLRVLCKKCHREYDKTSTDDYEKIEKDEIIAIGKAMEVVISDKKKAIEAAHQNGFSEINANNSIFANVNSAVNVWWLEPDNQKFSKDLYLLLSNTNTKELFILKIPAGKINNPETIFRQRTVYGKPKSSIEIIVDTNNRFIDRKSDNFDFSPFLEKTITVG